MHGLHAWGSASFSSFLSSQQSSLSPAVLSFFPPSFLSCSGFLPSLCTCNALPRTLFSTLTDAVGYLLKVYSSFCHRILAILGLREGGPKTWSRGGHITQFWLIICTRKSLWNNWKDFPYLLRERYARKSSHPSACLASQKLIVRPCPAADHWKKGKGL